MTDAVTTPAADRLEHLLREGPEQARLRRASALDRLAEPNPLEMIFIGAGVIGRDILAKLRAHGLPEPLAFAENNPLRWGSSVDGLPVLSLPDAVRTYGNRCVFVIAVGSEGFLLPLDRLTRQLRGLGVTRMASFIHLYWKHPEVFLPWSSFDRPEHVAENAQSVRTAFSLMSDEASRREFMAQVAWRLHLDAASMAPPVAHDIYFPLDLAPCTEEDVFVDVGAFDGDTLRPFLAHHGERFGRYIGLEPDPGAFERLAAYADKLPPGLRSRVDLHQVATGSRSGRVLMDALGNGCSTTGTGSTEVPMLPLDVLLEGLRPTWLKFDVEGAEADALAGAASIIATHRPCLAVSLYHRQADLWRLPLQIHALSPGYRMYLRPHYFAYWDYVLYAIPVQG